MRTAAPLATAGTTLTISAADALKIGYNSDSSLARSGAILQVYTSTGTTTVTDNGEKVQVTAWLTSTTATITRSYGATADPGTTYASGTDFKLVGWPVPENSQLYVDQSQARTPRYNLTQIFARDIVISRNQQIRKMRTIEDELAYQVDQRSIEVVRELNNSVLHGSPSAAITGTFPLAVASSGDNRTLAGINYFLRIAGGAAAGANYDTTSEDFDPTVLNNQTYAVVKWGARPTHILTGFKQQRVMQGFGSSLVYITPNEKIKATTPAFTTWYRTDSGPILATIVDGNFGDGAQGSSAQLDMSRIRLRPVLDSALFLRTAPTLNDGDAARLIGEWGLEVRNAVGTLKAHALHTGLSVPA